MSMDARVTTLCDELCRLNLEVVSSGDLSYISVEPTLQEQIVRAQVEDKGVQVINYQRYDQAKGREIQVLPLGQQGNFMVWRPIGCSQGP